MVFESMKDFCIGQVLSLVNIRLSDLIIGLIVQVFGRKGSSINGGIARICFANQMLFNLLHDRHLWSEAVRQGALFCVWLEAFRRALHKSSK